MIFIDNKYTTWYYNIVTKAQSRSIPNTYTEKHHIIPVSLGGTDNDVVSLTAREHYICHILLTKMTEGMNRRKMLFALKLMGQSANKNQKRYTSRLFEYYRPQIANAISENNKGRLSPMKGKKLPPDHPCRKKLSEKAKQPHRRKAQLAALQKAVEVNTGKKRPEFAKKISSIMTGKPKSEEHKKNLKKSWKNRKEVICPHCNKSSINVSMMKRWHFDRCKNQ